MSPRILVLALGTFVISSGVYLIAGLLPDVAARGHVSVAVAGQLITVHALTCAIGAPLLSALFGHVDRRKLLWVAMALFVVGNAATALLPDFSAMVLSRIVAAIGASLFVPVATVIAADLAPPDRRARAAALVTGGMTLATVIGVPAGLLLRDVLGFTGVFWLVAALGCAVAGAVFVVPHAPSVPRRSASRAGPSVLGMRAVRVVLVVSLLGSLADFAAYTYSVPMFTGFGVESLQVILLTYGIAGAVGNYLGGRVTDRYGSAVGISGSLGLLALGLVALPLAQGSTVGTLVAAVLWGAGGWGIMPAAQHRVLGLAPWAASVVISLNASAVYLGMAFGGVAGGAVLGGLGVTALGPVSALIAVAGLVAFGAPRLRGLRIPAVRMPAARVSAARLRALPVVRFPLGSRAISATWLPRTRAARRAPLAARRSTPDLAYLCTPQLLTGAVERGYAAARR